MTILEQRRKYVLFFFLFEQSTIQAEEVKSMISDVDSLLSKSDVEGLLSPSKASPSKTVKAASSGMATNTILCLLFKSN